MSGPNQYLIKASAVDVNPVGIYIRSGIVPSQLKFPYILGRDLAGRIVACGKNATKFQVGDRVWCVGQGGEGWKGTFAEFAAVDEGWLNPIPEKVSDEAVAAVSPIGITAHSPPDERSRLWNCLAIELACGGKGNYFM